MTKFLLSALLGLVLVLLWSQLSSAQEEAEVPPAHPTAWVREAEPTPDPEAVPTPWGPTRPVYRRRHSQQQIVIPEADPEELRKQAVRDRSEEQLDAVFGQ